MDCYFVSVAIRDKPELKNKPIVVCHSNINGKTGEISSANYIAREYGIKAGQFIGTARQRCKDLIILDYKFKDYLETSKMIYKIFFQYSNIVQSQSIDEAYIEFPKNMIQNDEISLANKIRNDILNATKCECSAGIGNNIIMARIATKKAKPNGTFYIRNNIEFMNIIRDMDISELPGVGWSNRSKFIDILNVTKCGELMNLKKYELVQCFGKKTGDNFYNYVRGIDNRVLITNKLRKSINCEVGWGVRFNTNDQMNKFVHDLCKHICNRMHNIDKQLKGHTIQVKVKCRHPNAPEEPGKFLGQGWCNTFIKSVNLSIPTNDVEAVYKNVMKLIGNMGNKVRPNIVRSVGISINKLNYGDGALRRNVIGDQDVAKNMKISDMFGGVNIVDSKEEKKQRELKEMNMDKSSYDIQMESMPNLLSINKANVNKLPKEYQMEIAKNCMNQLINDGKNVEQISMKLKEKFSDQIVNEILKDNMDISDNDTDSDNDGIIIVNKKGMKSLFKMENFNEYRSILLDFLKTYDIPNDDHKNILTMYLNDCIQYNKLDYVLKILKYLNSHCILNPNWIEISQQLINETNDKVEAKFGYKLKLD